MNLKNVNKVITEQVLEKENINIKPLMFRETWNTTGETINKTKNL